MTKPSDVQVQRIRNGWIGNNVDHMLEDFAKFQELNKNYFHTGGDSFVNSQVMTDFLWQAFVFGLTLELNGESAFHKHFRMSTTEPRQELDL